MVRITFFRGEGGLGFAKGKMLYLPNGDLVSPMSGGLQTDSVARSWIVKSTDQGRTWRYYATIDYSPKDPNPELPGHYVGACEPSFVGLPNGQMLAIFRSLVRDEPRRMGVQRFRTLEEANASRNDPYRR